MEFVTMEECVRFHGHLCGGVAMGYIMARYAMVQIGAKPGDPLFCQVEFQNCMTDAVQCVTGCTIGKGNLTLRPMGKRAMTLVHRDTGKGVRVTAVFDFPEGVSREESAEILLNTDPNTICRATEAELTVPARREITYGCCPVCGEEYDLSCGKTRNDQLCCPDCAAHME